MLEEKKRKLRIGLLIESISQPGWICRMIEDIEKSHFAEIVLIAKKEFHDHVRKFLPGLSMNGYPLLWSLYAKIDKRYPCPYRDPFEQFDLSYLEQRGNTILSVRPIAVNGEYHLKEEDVQRIRSENVDVVLNFWGIRITGAAVGIAKHGIWSGSPSNNSVSYVGPPCFWEVMRRKSTIEFTLRMADSETAPERVLYRSLTATDLLSVTGTTSKVYWKSAASVVRTIRNLYEDGPAVLSEENLKETINSHNGKRLSYPTTPQILGSIAKICGRRLKHSLWRFGKMEQWFLAYTLGSTGPSIHAPRDLKFMKPPKDRFWADPFAVAKDGKYYIFIEEFLYETMKGHISVIEMDPDGTWKQPVKVLEKDYHLSYPFLFEWGNHLYMIPETKRNNTIELYRCVEFPTIWQFDRVLIPNIQAVDATLHEQDGVWWLFCCVGGKDFASNDELHLFYSETPFGEWIPHKRNPVKSNVRSSRPAGKLFRLNGSLYRPSQDCSVRMGSAMVMNKVTRLTHEQFHEEIVGRIEPTWAKRICGTHTINTVDKFAVLDCVSYVQRFLP
ncbi:MAG: hypothetical protein ACLQPD_08010 [Desulfomonilaceae bacterium]